VFLIEKDYDESYAIRLVKYNIGFLSIINNTEKFALIDSEMFLNLLTIDNKELMIKEVFGI